MEINRLGSGEKISSASAVLLFAFMFLDWFGVESSSDSLSLFNIGRTPWEALDYVPIALLAAIVATLANAALRLTSASPAFAVPANAVIAGFGSVSVVLILVRMLHPPTFGSMGTSFGTVTYDGTIQLPMFFALAAALGIVYGGLRAMRA